MFITELLKRYVELKGVAQQRLHGNHLVTLNAPLADEAKQFAPETSIDSDRCKLSVLVDRWQKAVLK